MSKLLRRIAAAERSWLLWPPIVFFALALGLPIIALLIQALAGDTNPFAEALVSSAFRGSMTRTLLMAVIVTLLTVLLGTFYALAIAIAPKWISAFLVVWLFLSLWTSIMVRSFGWMLIELPRGALFWVLDVLGIRSEPVTIYQTAVAMYPAMVAVMLPFVVLPVLTAFRSIHTEQIDAAFVFGAGPLLTFRSVVIPGIASGMMSGGVLIFVMSLGFYVTPLLLGGPSNLTISGLIDVQMNVNNRLDVGAAMSVLLIATTVVIYLIADKLFRVSEKWGRA